MTTQQTAVKPFREMIDGKLHLNLHEGQSLADQSTARIIALLWGTQSGKALDIDTPIPTPAGFVAMAALKAGDTVFDEAGKACAVIFATPIQYNRGCYCIKFADGNSLVADASHLWATQTQTQRKHNRPATVKTTAELLTTLHGRKGRANHSIHLAQAIKYPKRILPIPPYTFGAWLGGGKSSGARIYTADTEVVSAIREEGVFVGPGCKQKEGNKSLAYCIGKDTRGGNDKKNPVLAALRGLKCINDKHIPEQYLTASIEQRTALLKGLMDTDGYCGSSGQSEFSTTKPLVATGISCLLASLGIKARVKTRRACCNGKDCGVAYRIMFTTDAPVFALERKLVRQVGGKRPDNKKRYIRDIVPVPSRPVKCIQVDSASSLYLAGRSYIPTHNTAYGPHWLYDRVAKSGGGDYLAVTSTFDLFKAKMLPELREVFEYILGVGRYWSGERVIELAEDLQPGKFWASKADDRMWGRIVLRSAESRIGLEAWTALAAWLDEAGMPEFKREAWEGTLRRLSLSQGRCLITTTLYEWGWLKTEVFDRWIGGDRDIQVIQMDSIVNPVFPREEYERARKTMPLWKFNLFYRGIYTRPAGLIYDSFDEAQCVIKRFPIPPEWLWYVGHDFGTNNTGVVCYAQDPATGHLFLAHTYLAAGATYEHVQELKGLLQGRTIIKRVGGAATEDGWRESFTQCGWPIAKPSERDVEVGIGRVYALHSANRISVFDDLLEYLDEKRAYSRKLDDNFQPTSEIRDKSRFHLLDAERYVLSEDQFGQAAQRNTGQVIRF